MQVWLTPADRDGRSWRLEVRPDGRVRVFQRTGGSVAGAPLREVRNMREVGAWLLERGIDPEHLAAG